MAPVTRRAAKAQEESPEKEQVATSTTKETLFEEPIVLRSKEIPSSDPVDEHDGHDKHDENDEHGEQGEQGVEGEGVENATIATPKSNKLEVTTQQESTSTGTKTTIDIQIPSSVVKTPRSRFSPIPDSQEAQSDDEADQTFEPLSASKQLEEEATQKLASQGRLLGSNLESTLSEHIGFEGKGEEGDEDEDEPTSNPKAAPKTTRVVFVDDDDDGAEHDQSDDDDDDDDEAPEAVSTAVVAKEILKSAKAARKAAEQYAESTKRKRQARDDLLKQQAQKRKRTNPSKPEEGDDEQNNRPKRQRRTQRLLPDVLPAEFLTDSSEDEEDDETTLKKIVKRPQKITFDTTEDNRPPRDEFVGSTRYRVLAQQSDPRLAPKANKDSRKFKEALLRRGRTRVAQNKKRGFFVK